MAEIKYCKECRKIFQSMRGEIFCPVCKQKDDEDFEKVRVFLRDFPGANMQEVSEHTEVRPAKINRWLKEDRLEVSKDSPVALNCEKCGVRIRSGRFCGECTKDLGREMMRASNALKENLKRGEGRGPSIEKEKFGLYYKHKNKNE